MESADDLTRPPLKFDQLTKESLLARLKKAFEKSENKHDSVGRSELLISILEGFSESYHVFDQFKPEPQERRRDRLISIANHLKGIVDQLRMLDGAAAEYACFLSFNELLKLEKPDHVTPDTWTFDDMVACASFNDSLPETLTAFENGIRAAEKALPLHSYNTSGKYANWYSAPPQLSMALALERQFWEFGLKFTITNTGLAADCLRAIYKHTEIKADPDDKFDRVDYWLKQARDHKDSMFNFMKIQKQPEK